MERKRRLGAYLIFWGMLHLCPGSAAASPAGKSAPADDGAHRARTESVESGTAAPTTADDKTAPESPEADAPNAPNFPDTTTPVSGNTHRARKFVHRLGAELRPEYVAPTHSFLSGRNHAHKRMTFALSEHLKYSFRFAPGSRSDRIFGGVYQGFGLARYGFGNPDELGSPIAVYLFQGARIARISRRLSFGYEWNFGLSFGWRPSDPERNPANQVMGSKTNAYLNADFYLDWRISPRLDLNAGLTLTHFSNGNTAIPNLGLNTLGAKVGLVYNFGLPAPPDANAETDGFRPAFPRHMCYDLVFFGSWRRKGVPDSTGALIASPDTYTVVGFNFSALYNLGYKFRAGLSLDGVYDGSANVYTENYTDFYRPSPGEQLALGVSARGEFVMPYFTVGLGLGVNILHRGGDLKSFYQMLTLKIAATRRIFIHIGYCLQDFQMPNYLMLGAGFRFNDKYPRLR